MDKPAKYLIFIFYSIGILIAGALSGLFFTGKSPEYIAGALVGIFAAIAGGLIQYYISERKLDEERRITSANLEEERRRFDIQLKHSQSLVSKQIYYKEEKDAIEILYNIIHSKNITFNKIKHIESFINSKNGLYLSLELKQEIKKVVDKYRLEVQRIEKEYGMEPEYNEDDIGEWEIDRFNNLPPWEQVDELVEAERSSLLRQIKEIAENSVRK
jgi:hypothetical protein